MVSNPVCASDTESSLARRERSVLIALVLGAILIRLIYFAEMNETGLARYDEWHASDMAFFQTWSRSLREEDWWQDRPLHPNVGWMRTASNRFLRENPDERPRFLARARAAQPDTEKPFSDEMLSPYIWQTWFGGKRYYQEPLYPYLIAGVARVFGTNVRWVLALQMLAGVLSVVGLHQITRRFFGHTVAAVAGAIFLLYAPLLFYEAILLRVSFIVATGLVLVWILPQTECALSARRALIGGLLCGVAVLLKTTFGVLCAGLWLGVFLREWRRGKRRALIPPIAALALGAGLLLTPVIVRNIKVGVAPLSWTSVGALAFISGNTVDAPHGAGNFFSQKYIPQIMAETGGEFMPTVLATLRTHPDAVSVAKMFACKLDSTWHWWELPNNASFYYWRKRAAILRLPVTFYFIAPLGLVGLAIGLRRLRDAWPLYALALTSFVPMLIVTNMARYRLPLAVALLPFAALMLVRVGEWFSRKQFRPAFIVIVAVGLIFISTGRRAGYEPIRGVDYRLGYQLQFSAAVEKALAAKDFRRAAKIFRVVLAAEPNHVRDIKAASAYWRPQVIRSAIYFADVHQNLAVSYRESNQLERAVKEFKITNALHDFVRAAQEKPKVNAP